MACLWPMYTHEVACDMLHSLPWFFSATGGLAHEATIFYKLLASLLSNKWGDRGLLFSGLDYWTGTLD